MTTHGNLLVASFLILGACATPATTGSRDVRQNQLQEFQLIQQVFRTEYTAPQTMDFPGHGRVTVRDVSLDGFPGHSYVRCRFHYQNRTAQPVVQAWVSLDVLDKHGRVVSTETAHCINLTCGPLERGSYYSDELRTFTKNAHLEPGWSWRVRCVSDQQQEDEPLDPPAPGRWMREYPPMFIKDRSWPYASGWDRQVGAQPALSWSTGR
jgi:hypothetical protein